ELQETLGRAEQELLTCATLPCLECETRRAALAAMTKERDTYRRDAKAFSALSWKNADVCERLRWQLGEMTAERDRLQSDVAATGMLLDAERDNRAIGLHAQEELRTQLAEMIKAKHEAHEKT